MTLTDKRKKEILTLVIVFTSVLLVSALAVYLIAGRSGSDSSRVGQTTPRDAVPTGSPTITPELRPTESPGVVEQLFGRGVPNDAYNPNAHWTENVGRIAFRLLLAALLGAALAFRPRQRIRSLKQNPYVSQTQILLAIVAAALMIIVGDNAARAFGYSQRCHS